MVAAYDLIVIHNSEQKSFVNDFGSGVETCNTPNWAIKELASNDWKDCEGKDYYVPSDGLLFGEAELEIDLCYSGKYNTWTDTCDSILDFMRKGEMQVYCGYSKEGWTSCIFSGISDVDYYADEMSGDVVEYTIKFKIMKYEKMASVPSV